MAVIAWRRPVFVFGKGTKYTQTKHYTSSGPQGRKTAKMRRLDCGKGFWSPWQNASSHSLSLRLRRVPNWRGLRQARPNRHIPCCHLDGFQLDTERRRRSEDPRDFLVTFQSADRGLERVKQRRTSRRCCRVQVEARFVYLLLWGACERGDELWLTPRLGWAARGRGCERHPSAGVGHCRAYAWGRSAETVPPAFHDRLGTDITHKHHLSGTCQEHLTRSEKVRLLA